MFEQIHKCLWAAFPLRLLCLLTAKERHIPSVLKELFAVPKLAESHSYLSIGSPRGSWRRKERQRRNRLCLALFVVVSSPLVSHCLSVCVPFSVKEKPKVAVLSSPAAALCHCLLMYPNATDRWLWGLSVGQTCSKSVARTECATQTLSFHFPEQITYPYCFVKLNIGKWDWIRQHETYVQIQGVLKQDIIWSFLSQFMLKICDLVYLQITHESVHLTFLRTHPHTKKKPTHLLHSGRVFRALCRSGTGCVGVGFISILWCILFSPQE